MKEFTHLGYRFVFILDTDTDEYILGSIPSPRDNTAEGFAKYTLAVVNASRELWQINADKLMHGTEYRS